MPIENTFFNESWRSMMILMESMMVVAAGGNELGSECHFW